MDIPPKDRQDAKNALAYLASRVNSQPDDTTNGTDLLKAFAADGSSPADLANGMATLVSMLCTIRSFESNKAVAETLQDLGKHLATGE